MRSTPNTRANRDAIAKELEKRWPTRILPWGALSVVASDLHFSREYIRQVATAEGFRTQHATMETHKGPA
jgi:hypothetical protein